MSRALDELGMLGVTAGTTVLGKSIADPAFDAFWAELDRRKCVLFLHPVGGSAGSQMIEAEQAHLAHRRAAGRYRLPAATHAGRNNAALSERKSDPPASGRLCALSDGAPRRIAGPLFVQLRSPPSVQAKSFWYDTVNAHPWALRCARETVGTDRLLMGTDYPFWVDDASCWPSITCARPNFPPTDVELILGGNAQAAPGFSEARAC